MTGQIIAGVSTVLIALSTFFATRRQIKKNGEDNSLRKQAERHAKDSLQREHDGNAADLDDDQYDKFIDSL